MKKFIISLMAAVLLLSTTAIAADMKFEPEGKGKWIFCNNPEAIANEDLMNSPDGESSYIMNNYNLSEDTYDFLICHINNTSTSDGYGAGFDIELDVEMTARENTTLTINKVFFETPQNESFIFSDGTWAKEMHKVGCLNALSSYLGVNFCERNGSWLYTAEEYEPKTIEIKKGETVWLGDYIDNYDAVPYQKPVEIMGQIVIEKGALDFNVAAFKSGEELHDRSGFNPKAAYGKYSYTRTQKGIANSLPKVNLDLSYTIDNTYQDGDYIKNKVFNQYEPKGYVTDVWCTNLNPQDDAWSKKISVENDLLTLTYEDDSKLDYYGKKVQKRFKNNIWTWDQFHSDTAQYEGKATWFYDEAEYYPNYEITPYRANEGYACSMGNYCVTESYNLKVKNTTSKDKYFNYVSQTISNIVVYISDEEGVHSGYAKGEGMGDAKDVLASVKIPARGEKEFSINVVLPINYVGGIRSSFMISDEKRTYKTYEDYLKESVSAEKGPMTYGVTADTVYDKLSDEVKEIIEGNRSHFEILETDFGYVLRYMDWDGIPYYYTNHWTKLKNLYILDKDYNLLSHYTPEKLTVRALNYDGYYYREDADGYRFRTRDGMNWEEYNHRLPLPNITYNNDAPSKWAQEEVSRAFETDVAPYDIKDKLSYDKPMTRSMFCYVLSNMLKRCDIMPEEIDEDITFTDTDSNTIRRLASAGIISGYTDSTFRPEGKITRQEAALLLMRVALYANKDDNALLEYDKEMESYYKEKDTSEEKDTVEEKALYASDDLYTDDKEIGEWAYLAVYSMRDAKIMQGMVDGSFSPKLTYTNEQSIATIMRLYDFITKAQ